MQDGTGSASARPVLGPVVAPDAVTAVAAAVEPLLADAGFELVDVEVVRAGRSSTLRLRVDRPGGVDLEACAEATRIVEPSLDRLAALEVPHTLEVSSPGLERPLRTTEHLRRHRGTLVTVRTGVPVDGARRHRGTLVDADDDVLVLRVEGEAGAHPDTTGGVERRLPRAVVVSTRTVFEWGPAPKPSARTRTPATTRTPRSTR